MKKLLPTLTIAAMAITAHADDYQVGADNDPIWGPGGYVAHLDQVVGHEGRGASAADIRYATTEEKWLNANEAHIKKLMQWLKDNGGLQEAQ